MVFQWKIAFNRFIVEKAAEKLEKVNLPNVIFIILKAFCWGSEYRRQKENFLLFFFLES